jgi:hypothetical protein
MASRRKYQARAYRDGGAVKVEPDDVALSMPEACADVPPAPAAPIREGPVALSSDGDDAVKRALEATRRAEALQRQHAQQPTRPDAPPTVDHEIGGLQLPENAKDYLRRHPELMTDPVRKRQLGSASNYLVDNRGLRQFSPEYFTALDRELGFAPEPALAPTPARRSIPLSAPVSRDVPTASGRRMSEIGNITLSPAEREIARNSFAAPDLTNEQKERMYAEAKHRMLAMREAGTLNE